MTDRQKHLFRRASPLDLARSVPSSLSYSFSSASTSTSLHVTPPPSSPILGTASLLRATQTRLLSQHAALHWRIVAYLSDLSAFLAATTIFHFKGSAPPPETASAERHATHFRMTQALLCPTTDKPDVLVLRLSALLAAFAAFVDHPPQLSGPVAAAYFAAFGAFVAHVKTQNACLHTEATDRVLSLTGPEMTALLATHAFHLRLLLFQYDATVSELAAITPVERAINHLPYHTNPLVPTVHATLSLVSLRLRAVRDALSDASQLLLSLNAQKLFELWFSNRDSKNLETATTIYRAIKSRTATLLRCGRLLVRVDAQAGPGYTAAVLLLMQDAFFFFVQCAGDLDVGALIPLSQLRIDDVRQTPLFSGFPGTYASFTISSAGTRDSSQHTFTGTNPDDVAAWRAAVHAAALKASPAPRLPRKRSLSISRSHPRNMSFSKESHPPFMVQRAGTLLAGDLIALPEKTVAASVAEMFRAGITYNPFAKTKHSATHLTLHAAAVVKALERHRPLVPRDQHETFASLYLLDPPQQRGAFGSLFLALDAEQVHALEAIFLLLHVLSGLPPAQIDGLFRRFAKLLGDEAFHRTLEAVAFNYDVVFPDVPDAFASDPLAPVDSFEHPGAEHIICVGPVLYVVDAGAVTVRRHQGGVIKTIPLREHPRGVVVGKDSLYVLFSDAIAFVNVGGLLGERPLRVDALHEKGGQVYVVRDNRAEMYDAHFMLLNSTSVSLARPLLCSWENGVCVAGDSAELSAPHSAVLFFANNLEPVGETVLPNNLTVTALVHASHNVFVGCAQGVVLRFRATTLDAMRDLRCGPITQLTSIDNVLLVFATAVPLILLHTKSLETLNISSLYNMTVVSASRILSTHNHLLLATSAAPQPAFSIHRNRPLSENAASLKVKKRRKVWAVDKDGRVMLFTLARTKLAKHDGFLTHNFAAYSHSFEHCFNTLSAPQNAVCAICGQSFQQLAAVCEFCKLAIHPACRASSPSSRCECPALSLGV